MKLTERQTVFLRMEEKSAILGRETVSPEPGMRLRYNWDGGDLPTFDGELARHADAHGGRVLMPFNGNQGVVKILQCSTFVLWVTDGRWLSGRIVAAGEDYRLGMDDGDGWTAPSTVLDPTATRWVKLDHVVHGDSDFPFDRYETRDYRSGGIRTPLYDRLRTSHSNFLYADRKEQ